MADLTKELIEVEKFNFDQVTIDTHHTGKAPLGIPSNLKLTEKEFNEVSEEIKKYIQAIEEDGNKAALVARLVKSEMAVKGEFDPSNDTPWKTASKVESTITGTHCKTITNAIVRTLAVEPYL
jgi:hypothetical protein